MQDMLFNTAQHLEKLRIALRRIAAGHHYSDNWHTHRYSELAIILESEGVIHHLLAEDGSTQKCSLVPGDVLLLHPKSVHCYHNASSLHIVNILFNPEQLPVPALDGAQLALFQTVLDPKGSPTGPVSPIAHLEFDKLAEVVRLCAEMEAELSQKSVGWNLAVYGLFLAILVRLCRPGGLVQRRTDEGSALPALHHINLHFREKLDIAHLAHISHLSRNSLFRQFRDLTGVTPMQYQRRKRLETAEYMLRQSRRPISEIALSCGFCDSNHFIREFSKHYGISPAAFRRKL